MWVFFELESVAPKQMQRSSRAATLGEAGAFWFQQFWTLPVAQKA
jgi:hypothetical protein